MPHLRARRALGRRRRPRGCRRLTARPRGRMARMARIGLLTGGGDCPGLNPVIRGIVRKGIDHYGHEIFGFRKGWKGVLDNDAIELTRENTSGILHKGGTILGTSRTNVYKTENGEERVLASLKERGIDVLIPIGGDDTLGVARKLFDGRLSDRRRAQDDRQRPQRDGLHVRLSDRGADRDRGDRPPALDGRVARPRDRLRGHGPRRRLDRLLLAAWPAAPTSSSCPSARSTSTRSAATSRTATRRPARRSRSSSSPRARRRPAAATRRRPPTRSTPSATPASAGSPTSSRSRSRRRPATSAARRCSATSSAAARRSPSTASSAPASASRRSTPPPTATTARWSRCTAPTSSSSRSRTR